MFNFIVKYFTFLKYIPLFPHLFDGLLKLLLLISNKKILDYIDEIENEVLTWENTSMQIHKYGGIQFNHSNKEIGHIHGNGLLDIHFSKQIKSQLPESGNIIEHHVFKNSGWISLYIRTISDKQLAIELLKYSYNNK